ncbi:hypothetical protein EON63_11260 [archaeon]|nr:MAG: hypothetical protein EON63_11260 [archaeon]
MIFGGENIGAVVADVGSHFTRIGYAGEDCPRAFHQTVSFAFPPSGSVSSLARFHFVIGHGVMEAAGWEGDEDHKHPFDSSSP